MNAYFGYLSAQRTSRFLIPYEGLNMFVSELSKLRAVIVHMCSQTNPLRSILRRQRLAVVWLSNSYSLNTKEVYFISHLLLTASTSNTEILDRFQSKALLMIVDAPWYVPNTVIRRDLQISTVKEEIRYYSSQYSARLSAHPNDLIINLMELPDSKRLRKHLLNNLTTKFLVYLS
jgi:hypothetical protein